MGTGWIVIPFERVPLEVNIVDELIDYGIMVLLGIEKTGYFGFGGMLVVATGLINGDTERSVVPKVEFVDKPTGYPLLSIGSYSLDFSLGC